MNRRSTFSSCSVCVILMSCIFDLSCPVWSKSYTRRWITKCFWYHVGACSWMRLSKYAGRISAVQLWYGASEIWPPKEEKLIARNGFHYLTRGGSCSMGVWMELRCSFVICQWSLISSTARTLNNFYHLAKATTDKPNESDQSGRCRSQSGIKGRTCQQLQTAEKSSKTHFTPTLTYQIPVSSNILDVKPTFSLVEKKQGFGGMIQALDLEPSK